VGLQVHTRFELATTAHQVDDSAAVREPQLHLYRLSFRLDAQTHTHHTHAHSLSLSLKWLGTHEAAWRARLAFDNGHWRMAGARLAFVCCGGSNERMIA
jgi:hypothetical protein